jgi:hypothetical protein
MDQTSTPHYTLEAARVATGSEDERGIIIRFDGQITAVLVKLGASYHGSVFGFWYLEIGFGRCAGTPPPFERLADALAWIAGRLNDLTPGLAELFGQLEAAFIFETEAEYVIDKADGF